MASKEEPLQVYGDFITTGDLSTYEVPQLGPAPAYWPAVTFSVRAVPVESDTEKEKVYRLTEEIRRLEERRADEMVREQEARRGPMANPSVYEPPIIEDDPTTPFPEVFDNQRAALDALSDEELAERTRRKPRREARDPTVPVPVNKARRQVAVLEISAELLVTMFMEGARGYEVVENAVPGDVGVYGASYDPLRQVFRLALSHPSFREVDENEEFPSLPPPKIRMTTDGQKLPAPRKDPNRGPRAGDRPRDSINDTWSTGGR